MTPTQSHATIPSVSRITRWRKLSWLSAGLSGIAAVAYAVMQFRLIGGMQDPLFVLILLANTHIAICFGFYFERKLGRMLAAFNETDPAETIEPAQAIDSIFHHGFAVPVALVFAAVLAGWVYVLAPWTANAPAPYADMLNTLLAAFLFCSNLIIGYGLYCVMRFWLLAARRIKRVDLNILVPNRPDLALFREIIRDLVILIATIATLAVLSLTVSQIDLGTTTVLFSIFALGTVMASYLVPVLPMTWKFQETKHKELHRVERRIDAIYQDMLAKNDPTSQSDQLNGYVALRDQLKSVRTLPPGGEFSIVTSATVTFVTFLPAIID